MSLLQITIGASKPTKHELLLDKTVLGRAAECNVLIPDASVSKRHFAVESILGDYFIYDLGSKNGTYLNGKRLTGKQVLHDRDVIEVGLVQVRYLDELSRNATLNTDSLMQVEGFTPRITILNGPHAGITYDVLNLLTTIGKRNQQVAILQQRPSGIFLTHLEGVSTTLNGRPIGSNSINLKSGDLIELCDTQLKMEFIETDFANSIQLAA